MHSIDPSIFSRKDEHIKLTLENEGFSSGDTWIDCVRVVHEPFSQINFSDIDLSTNFLGKQINAPVLIDAITGGTSYSYEINQRLAEFAAKNHLPICVGSQRIMQDPKCHLDSFKVVRKKNPEGVVLGNIGISQIIQMESFLNISEMMQEIEADGLCVHFNILQELIQHKDPLDFHDGMAKLLEFADYLPIPIILKEVGAGLSKDFAQRMIKQGFKYFNVAGYGGTNFTLLEAFRQNASESDSIISRLGHNFGSWGIPTAASVLEIASVLPDTGKLIASGGIRSGRDIGVCLSLGANLSGMALPFLKAASRGNEELEKFGKSIMAELKSFMFLTGTSKLEDLPKIPKVFLPPLSDWMKQRHLYHE